MDRIIVDTYMKQNKKIWGDDPNTAFNKKILAVNAMYGWLYEKGYLEKASFIFKDYAECTHFALDVQDLKPFRKEMEEAKVDGASLAVRQIFVEDYSPCTYSGAIQLGWTMSSYRTVDGMTGRSWECDLSKGLEYDSLDKILDARNEHGTKAAVRTMFAQYDWNPPIYEKKPEPEGPAVDKEQYQAALQHFNMAVGTDIENEYVQRFAEELIYCFENKKEIIDFDFWTRYEDLLGEKISYGEYSAIDALFDGDPHEIDHSDVSQIAEFKENLEKYRAALTIQRKSVGKGASFNQFLDAAKRRANEGLSSLDGKAKDQDREL